MCDNVREEEKGPQSLHCLLLRGCLSDIGLLSFLPSFLFRVPLFVSCESCPSFFIFVFFLHLFPIYLNAGRKDHAYALSLLPSCLGEFAAAREGAWFFCLPVCLFICWTV